MPPKRRLSPPAAGKPAPPSVIPATGKQRRAAQREELREEPPIPSPIPFTADVVENLGRAILNQREVGFNPIAALQHEVDFALLHEVAEGGPIMAYLDVLRSDAVGAFVELAGVDPTDVGSVARIQQAISAYVDMSDWIGGTLNAARLSGEMAESEGDAGGEAGEGEAGD